MLERLQPRVHSPPKQPENESRCSNTQLVDISMETRNNVPEFTYDIICRLLMENMTLRKTIFMDTPPLPLSKTSELTFAKDFGCLYSDHFLLKI